MADKTQMKIRIGIMNAIYLLSLQIYMLVVCEVSRLISFGPHQLEIFRGPMQIVWYFMSFVS